MSLEPYAHKIFEDYIRELIKLNLQFKRYYVIAKSLESLVISESLREVDSWDDKQFRDSLTTELDEFLSLSIFNLTSLSFS